MNTTTLVTLVDGSFRDIFIYDDLLVIFFLGLILLILAAKGADRISSIFVMSMCITGLAMAGALSQEIIYGLLLITGGILTAKAMITIFTR